MKKKENLIGKKHFDIFPGGLTLIKRFGQGVKHLDYNKSLKNIGILKGPQNLT